METVWTWNKCDLLRVEHFLLSTISFKWNIPSTLLYIFFFLPQQNGILLFTPSCMWKKKESRKFNFQAWERSNVSEKFVKYLATMEFFKMLMLSQVPFGKICRYLIENYLFQWFLFWNIKFTWDCVYFFSCLCSILHI